MPELPEVETVVRELDYKLQGKTIKNVQVLLGKIVALGPGTVPPKRRVHNGRVEKFIKFLRGQKIKSVKRRAKLLIFDFVGPYAMLVHLKMTGQFIYFKKTELNKKVRIINRASAPLHSMPCKFTHVIFTFADGSKLFYNDVRQFGYLKLVSDQELPHVRELSEFGPEPLDPKFTKLAFFTIVKNASKRKVTIKQLLIDSKFVAGIGNIYSDEILFRAKIRPTRKVSSISEQVASNIFKAIKIVLKKGIEAKGSSVGDFIRTDGSWGQMGRYHYVYMRSGEPCKVCGTIIKSAKFNGRTGSYCPSCQR